MTMEPSWSPPPSPGQRRKTLPGLRRPRASAYADLSRPDTVPVKRGRSIRPLFTVDLGRGNAREGPGVDSGSCFGDEWIKSSWRKGECRQEIKLVAAVSGLTFDEARIVVSDECCNEREKIIHVDFTALDRKELEVIRRDALVIRFGTFPSVEEYSRQVQDHQRTQASGMNHAVVGCLHSRPSRQLYLIRPPPTP